jgi:negative regulator of flagellin synthesis FlgM
MKITRRPSTGAPEIGPPVAAPEPPEGSPAGGGGRGTDRVELSAEARLRARLHRAVGDVAAVPAVPAERVAALGAEAARGAYQRDPRAVAERLLAELARDLLA